MAKDWVDEKAREMIKEAAETGFGVFSFCNKCNDLTSFSGDTCKKCGTKK